MADFTPFIELHSEEVHEIINTPPSWLVRSGTTLFFCLMLVLGVSTWYIKYPDMVTVPFTLTAEDAPRTIVSRIQGRISKLLSSDGDRVKSGQVIAFLESTADHTQLLELDAKLGILDTYLSKNDWRPFRTLSIATYTKLGEVQVDFQLFNQKHIELESFRPGGYITEKRKLLVKDLVDLQEMEKLLMQQNQLQRGDYQLAIDEFKMQEQLFGSKVISVLEYKKEKAKLIAREMPLNATMSSLLQNKSNQNSKHKELLEIDNLISEGKNAFRQSLQSLLSSINSWKQKHLLIASVSGIISYSAPWQEQQFVSLGTEMMTIEPDHNIMRGIVKIPQANVGKLAVGQSVLIKLDGFPYREYGLIQGVLSQVSRTPGKDSVYWGYVDLPHKLTTRYKKTLPYKNGLRGSGEIITQDKRLLERLLIVIKSGGK